MTYYYGCLLRVKMKTILKSLKPKTCANIMNLIQSILIIKDKKEAKAVQKLIDEYGYAEFLVYCTKDKKNPLFDYPNRSKTIYEIDDKYDKNFNKYYLNGKVLFKFRCYKVEEIAYQNLNTDEPNKRAYAIYISNPEIFDKPKELSEFYKRLGCSNCAGIDTCPNPKRWGDRLTKAPQNFCYVDELI